MPSINNNLHFGSVYTLPPNKGLSSRTRLKLQENEGKLSTFAYPDLHSDVFLTTGEEDTQIAADLHRAINKNKGPDKKLFSSEAQAKQEIGRLLEILKNKAVQLPRQYKTIPLINDGFEHEILPSESEAEAEPPKQTSAPLVKQPNPKSPKKSTRKTGRVNKHFPKRKIIRDTFIHLLLATGAILDPEIASMSHIRQ